MPPIIPIYREGYRYNSICIPYFYFIDNYSSSVLDKLADWLSQHFIHPYIPLYLPIYSTEASLIGHIFLLDMQAMHYQKGKYATAYEFIPIPTELEVRAQLQNTTLVESIAEHDDQLFQEYLHGHSIARVTLS